MAHGRETVRSAVVSAVTGLTTTGTNVFEYRSTPWGAEDLPGIDVRTPDEERAEEGTPNERYLTVTIDGVAKTGTSLADTLDDIADEVESAIASADIGAAMIYTGTETEIDGDAELPIGRIRLTYRVAYEY